MTIFKIDMHEIEQAANKIGAAQDQIPFAMSRVLNDAAFATRRVLAEETWPRHVTQRRKNFPSVVLHVDRSSKGHLTVAIRELEQKTPSLQRHAKGGVKRPRGRNLAIPLKAWVQRTSQGAVRKDMSPKAIIARTPKRALRITNRGIFVGEGGRLHLRYSLKGQALQPPDVPFEKEFERSMTYAINQLFEPRMQLAMATRRSDG